MVDKFKELFKSRKFYATIIVSVLDIINGQIGLVDQTTMLTVNGMVMSWILGQAVIDSQKK